MRPSPQQRTTCRIHQIIVAARRMIDRIPATARRPTLKANELRLQLSQIEQFNLAGIDQRQNIPIDI